MEDIKDSEIRIIGKDETYDQNTMPGNPEADCSKSIPAPEKRDFDRREGHYNKPRESGVIRRLVILFVLLVIVVNVIFFIFRSCMLSAPPVDEPMIGMEELENAMFDPEVPEGKFESLGSAADRSKLDDLQPSLQASSVPYCEEKETEINGIGLKLLIPVGAVPKFEVGRIDPEDSNIVLALQAADIRKDNGEIVGASVYNGEVVGKGLAKKGYVSIIRGKMRVGVTESSPLFEAAIQEGGDFFRQYPLVADGVMVENQPRGKAIRRAICQRGSNFFVVETLTPESFHDFAQALQDLNIDNAVYLVGSPYALGFLRDSNSRLHEWGESRFAKAENISYLIWKKQ